MKNIKENILKEFDEKFSDLTHVSCLDKSIPCGTVKDDVAKFISQSLDQAIKERDEEWREKIIDIIDSYNVEERLHYLIDSMK